MTLNTVNGMPLLGECAEDVYCRRFFTTYFSPHSNTFVPLSFSEDPIFLRDLVHLEEDFGEGRLELESLTCVQRSVCGIQYTDDAGIVSKPTEDLRT